MRINISEIFHSIQGEGARVGTANVFVRLKGCSVKHACFASGVNCDTEFESGSGFTLEQLTDRLAAFNCPNIIWTGGEPLDQLNQMPEIVDHFRKLGYYQALETSGLHKPVADFDFICVSPKVAEHVMKKAWGDYQVGELRYVRHSGQSIPEPALEADFYFLSPHFNGNRIDPENLNHCIQLVKDNPTWKLSVQLHKLINVL